MRPADGLYWSGSCWSYQRHEALLYADLQLAHEDYQRLVVQPYLDKPVRVFQAPMNILVRTEQPFTIQELIDYLNRAFRGIVDTDACGDGPVPECLVLLRADFDSLRETGKPGNDGPTQ